METNALLIPSRVSVDTILCDEGCVDTGSETECERFTQPLTHSHLLRKPLNLGPVFALERRLQTTGQLPAKVPQLVHHEPLLRGGLGFIGCGTRFRIQFILFRSNLGVAAYGSLVG